MARGIGCRSGAMTEYLAKRVGSTGQVFALDIYQEQLDVAKKRIEEAGLKNVTFIYFCAEQTHIIASV